MTNNKYKWEKQMAEMWQHINEQKEFLNKMDGLHKKWSANHSANCECKKEGWNK